MVKLWNFSSGQHLRTYNMPTPSEIISVLSAREGPNTFIVGLAWDRKIYIWPDNKKQTVDTQYILEDTSARGHTDDVSCLCRLSPIYGLLATGGDDGCVIFWKIQEGSSKSAGSRRYKLWDNTPATPAADTMKHGNHDSRSARRRGRGHGKNLASTMVQDGEAEELAKALECRTGPDGIAF